MGTGRKYISHGGVGNLFPKAGGRNGGIQNGPELYAFSELPGVNAEGKLKRGLPACFVLV